MEFFGTYLEVTPDSRLAWTNEEGDAGHTVTTVTFEENEGKTRLAVHNLYPSKEALDADGSTAALLAWRLGRSDLEIVLVEGNHDLRSGRIEPQAQISELPELEEPPFVFLHHPQQRAQAFVICGHIHPCVHLGGRARERLRLPCFWATQDFLVLPAFGEFTGCARVEPSPSDRIFVTDGVSVKQVTNRGAVAG